MISSKTGWRSNTALYAVSDTADLARTFCEAVKRKMKGRKGGCATGAIVFLPKEMHTS